MNLKDQFEAETGTPAINSQGEPDIDYVQWLEDKIQTPQPEGVKPEDLGNTYSAESSWSCYRCMQSNIPGTHVTYEETHVGCGGVCH